MRAKIYVLRNFYKYSGPNLVVFGTNVSKSVDVLLFPNLPVAPNQILILANTLNDRLADTLTGGPEETALKDEAFKALADALADDADYIEITVNGNLAMLLGTGFLPASQNTGSSPLDDTAIKGLYNNGSGQLLLRLAPVRNATSYLVQTSADGGVTWGEAIVSSQAMRIVLAGLTPTKTYLVRARAIGGSTGASAWVLSSAIVCT